MTNPTNPNHGKIITASTLAELKAKLPVLAPGYCYVVGRLQDGLHVDLYVSPLVSSGTNSAPESIPEGSRFVGTVNYPDRDAALRDLGGGP